jgi:LysR family transcriptional regulator, nod-box dependent transcriptional activator
MDDVTPKRGERSRPINLNLLPVLRELLRLHNITRAAEALNMSQSAVSDALGRLRSFFDDELLIPSVRGFVPSEKARALEPMLLEALERIEMMFHAAGFKPENAQGRIHIATSDDVALALGTHLVRELRALAPKLSVQFHDADKDSVGALAAGHLDFLLVPEATLEETPSHIEKVFIFEDQLVLTTNAAHSRAHDEGRDWSGPEGLVGTATATEFPSRPVIRQDVGDGERETIVLPAFMLLPFVAARTDIMTLVQRRLAERLAPAAGGGMIVPEFPLPTVRVMAAWRHSRSKDPLHRWLLALMVDIGAKLNSEEVDSSSPV